MDLEYSHILQRAGMDDHNGVVPRGLQTAVQYPSLVSYPPLFIQSKSATPTVSRRPVASKRDGQYTSIPTDFSHRVGEQSGMAVRTENERHRSPEGFERRFHFDKRRNMPGASEKRHAKLVADKLVKKAKSVLSVVNFPIGSSRRIAQLRQKYKESNARRLLDSVACRQAKEFNITEARKYSGVDEIPLYYTRSNITRGSTSVARVDYSAPYKEEFVESTHDQKQLIQSGGERRGVDFGYSNSHWPIGSSQDLINDKHNSREKLLKEKISQAYAEYYQSLQQNTLTPTNSAAREGKAYQVLSTSSHLVNTHDTLPLSHHYGGKVSSFYEASHTLPGNLPNGQYPDQYTTQHGGINVLNTASRHFTTNDPHRSCLKQPSKVTFSNKSNNNSKVNRVGRTQRNNCETAPMMTKPKPFSVGYLFQQNLVTDFTSPKKQPKITKKSRGQETQVSDAGPGNWSSANTQRLQNYQFRNNSSNFAVGSNTIKTGMGHITDTSLEQFRQQCLSDAKPSDIDCYMVNQDQDPGDSEINMRKLYVGDLLESVKKPDLEREFQVFGRVKDVWIAHNPPGFAFIEYYDRVGASNAVRSLDGKHVLGSKIRVEYAKSNGPRSGRGRKRRAASPPQPTHRRRSPSPRGKRSPPRRQRSPFPPLRSSSPPRRGLPPPPPIPPPLLDLELRRRDRTADRRGRYNGYDRARTPPPPLPPGYRPRSRSPISRRRSPGIERGYPLPLPPSRRSISHSPSPPGRNATWERREAWYRDADRQRDYPPLPPPPEVYRRSRSRSPVAPAAYSPRRSSPPRGHSPFQRTRSPPCLPRGRTPPPPRGRTPPPRGRTPPPRGRTPPPRGHTPLQRGRSPLNHGRSPTRGRSPPPLRAMLPPSSRPRSPLPRGHTPPPLRGHSPLAQRGSMLPLRGHTPQSPLPRGHASPRRCLPPPLHGRASPPLRPRTPPPHGRTPPSRGRSPPPPRGHTPARPHTPPPRGRTPPPLPRGHSPPPRGHTPPMHGRLPLMRGRTPPPLLRGRSPPPLRGHSPLPRSRMAPMVPRGNTPNQTGALHQRGWTPPPCGRASPPSRGRSPLPPTRNHSPPPPCRRSPPRGLSRSLSPLQHQRGRSPVGMSGTDRMCASPRPTAMRSNSPPRYR